MEAQQRLAEEKKQREHPGMTAAERAHDHEVGSAGIETKIGELRALMKAAEEKEKMAHRWNAQANKAKQEAERLQEAGRRLTQKVEGPAEHYKRAWKI